MRKTKTKMNPFRKWWSAATPAQKRRLARLAKTTVGSLHQLAGSYRTKGVLHASPELARRIEIGAYKMARMPGQPAMPQLLRTELCPACGRCEFAQRCAR